MDKFSWESTEYENTNTNIHIWGIKLKDTLEGNL